MSTLTAEQEALVRLTELTYDQLRQAFLAIPDDRLDGSPASEAMSPRRQIVHACGADRGYANRIDGGSRRTDFDLDRELRSRDELLAHLEETREMTLALIRSPDEMERAVEIPWRPDATRRFVLLHMLRHKHYHVGQLTLMAHLLG
ncbi:MAG: DinB family protein [Candidatus Brocadiia bacterium]